MARAMGLGLLLAAAVGCATVPAPALDAPNAGYGTSEDEQRLIRDHDKLESELRARGMVFRDPALDAYLARVAAPILPEQTAGGPRYHFLVIREPTINAFALANGGVIVHAGLLAAIKDESQLALLLGHEIAHTNLRHQLNGLQDFKRKTVFAKVASTTLAPAAAAFAGGLGFALVELMIGHTYVAAVNGYSREMEEAADLSGMRAVARAGYSAEHAPGLFEALNEGDEYDAVTTFFYGSHPRNSERLTYARALIERGEVPRNAEGRVGDAELTAAVSRVVLENIRLRLRARHYEFARLEVERAEKRYGETASLRYLEGEVHRRLATDPEGAARERAMRAHQSYDPATIESLRADGPRSLDDASAAYGRALELDPSFHAARRGLGEVALERGDTTGAEQLLNGYLDADPQAPDYRYVEKLLKRIREQAPVGAQEDP